MRFDFAGTNGVLQFDGSTHSVGICKEQGRDFIWSSGMRLSRDDNHRLQFENFFKAVDSGEPFVCTLEDAEATLKVILAAHESARQNRPVAISYAALPMRI
jgi:predicted dehydrogenase